MSAAAIYCVLKKRWIQHLVVCPLNSCRLRCLPTTIRDSFRRKTLLLIGERRCFGSSFTIPRFGSCKAGKLGVRQTALLFGAAFARIPQYGYSFFLRRTPKYRSFPTTRRALIQTPLPSANVCRPISFVVQAHRELPARQRQR